MNDKDAIGNISRELSGLMSAKGVLGDPLDLGSRMVIPVYRFGCAFGGNDGASHSGGGAGFGVDPVAVIVLHKDVSGAEGVQVMSLKKGSATAEVISSIAEALAPQILSAVRDFAGKDQSGQKERKIQDEREAT